jgi:hypothetical protein
MPRPRKLTDAQAEQVRRICDERRVLMAALRALPTLEELAEGLQVSVSVLKQISAGRTYRQREK